MPIFEFKCDDCDEFAEKMLFHSEHVSEDARYVEENFPECEAGHRMRRLFVYGGITHRSKGVFPYIEHNFGHDPIEVQDFQHRQKLMKERGLQDAIPHQDTAERLHMRWV